MYWYIEYRPVFVLIKHNIQQLQLTSSSYRSTVTYFFVAFCIHNSISLIESAANSFTVTIPCLRSSLTTTKSGNADGIRLADEQRQRKLRLLPFLPRCMECRRGLAMRICLSVRLSNM